MPNHQTDYQPNGIYSVLNQFYTEHQNDYEPDADSENLKTVLLKVGELPDLDKINIDDYLKNLPRHKIYKLAKFYGLEVFCTSESSNNLDSEVEIKTKKVKSELKKELKIILQKEQIKFENLNNWFDNYDKLRKSLLKRLWRELLKIAKKSLEQKATKNEPTETEILTNLKAKQITDWIFEALKPSTQECQRIQTAIDYASKQARENAEASLIKITLGIKNTENINKENKKDDLVEKHREDQALTNFFHDYVREVLGRVETENKEEKQQKDLKFGSSFLSNLVEEVTGGFLNYYKKLLENEAKFVLLNSDEKVKQGKVNKKGKYKKIGTFKFWLNWIEQEYPTHLIRKNIAFRMQKDQQKNKFKKKIDPKKYYQGVERFEKLLQAVRGEAKFLDKYNEITNLNYNEILAEYKSVVNHLTQAPDLKKFDQQRKQNIDIDPEKIKEMSKVPRLAFDHKKSFPHFEPKKKLHDFQADIDNILKKIDDLPNYEDKAYKVKIKDSKEVFREAIYSEIYAEKEQNPMGQARKIVDKCKDFKSKSTFLTDVYKEIRNLAEGNIASLNQKTIELKKNWVNIPDNEKNLVCLRELASWWLVLVKLELEILGSDKIEINGEQKSKQDLLKITNELASNIQGAYREFENEQESLAIYLSDAHRSPDKGTGFLSRDENGKLNLAISFDGETGDKKRLENLNFENKQSKDLGFLTYRYNKPFENLTKEINEILADKYQQIQDLTIQKLIENAQKDAKDGYFSYDFWNIFEPTKYKQFTKNQLTKANFSFDNQNSFLLPLQFSKNQERKYFWNRQNKTQDIFDKDSRLKISSMRLIKQYNIVDKKWEYFVSLAIYRLEKSNIKNQAEILEKAKENIIGIDAGAEQETMFSFGLTDKNGEVKPEVKLINFLPKKLHKKPQQLDTDGELKQIETLGKKIIKINEQKRRRI